MSKRTVTVTEFKANCLAMLDEVDRLGGRIIITKRGRAIAEVKRIPRSAWKNPAGSWKGVVKIVGDIVNEDTSGKWSVVSED
jgi:antitoxin (DNA-binding transcriptional repressor) of toxin-antitoxin stability system